MGFPTIVTYQRAFDVQFFKVKKTGPGIESIKAGVQKFRGPTDSTGGLTGT